MSSPSDDVLILGAGAAGLACAERLARFGRRFTVLEARNRIGGRAWTDYSLAPDFPLELGAQMVHGRHVVTHEWIRQSGLSARAWPIAQRSLISIDRRLCRAPWLAFPGYPGFGFRAYREGRRTLPERLRAMPPPDISLTEFLARQNPSPGGRRLVELLHAHAYAADSDEIGIRGPAEEERRSSEEYGYRNFRLDAGYTELFRRRSAQYFDRIRTGVRVSAVRRTDSGVRIEAFVGDSREPTTFVAPAVVVTVPLGVLKAGSILFEPPLPAEKTTAIRRIAFGMGYALQLRLGGRELTERLGDFSMVWAGGATTFHRPQVRRSITSEVLTAFTVGREARRRAQMGFRERIDATLAELTEALPVGTSVSSVTAHSVHLWPEDPFALGAYSFLPVDVGVAERQTLAEPVDNVIFFAGEATHFQGESATVHGAIETGYRAAEQVHRALPPGAARQSS